MKIRTRSPSSGNVLVVALVITGVIGITLAAHLTLTSSQVRATARSQNWNQAIVAAEAGIEEAMTQLNFVEDENMSANGWTLSGGKYTKQRTIGEDSYFLATIDEADYTITSTGYVINRPNTNYLSRTVQAKVDVANSAFIMAVIGRKHVKLRNEGIVDSYDSGPRGRGHFGVKTNGNGNAYGSTNNTGKGAGKVTGAKKGGKSTTAAPGHGYVASGRTDHAGVSAIGTKKDSVKVSKTTDVYGSAHVPPGGGIQVKDDAAVGSTAWINNPGKGMDPTRLFNNFRYDFPAVKAPFTSGYFTPAAEKIDGTDYQYVLRDGDYQLGKVDLKQDMLVMGVARLYVTDDFKTDTSSIKFYDTNSALKFYMGGRHFHVKSKGIINNSVPAYFQYYGLKNNKCFKIEKDAMFSGVVYAPNAKVRLKGNGDLYGSVIGKCVHADHKGSIHYDEALGRAYGDFEQFVIVSWKEL